MRTIIAVQVVLQGRDHGWVQRQFADLAEFAVADREQAIGRVEVIAVEADRLSDTHSGCRQHANQCPIRCLQVGPAQDRCRRHQIRDFVWRVEVRCCSARSTWQDTHWRHLGGRFDPMEVSGEDTNVRKSPGSPACIGACGESCPSQRRFGRQAFFAAIFDEGNELTEKSLCFVKLVAKGTPHGQIVCKSLAKGAHWTSPGHGRAIMRKPLRSTFAWVAVVSV
jgi:hypothetical protein